MSISAALTVIALTFHCPVCGKAELDVVGNQLLCHGLRENPEPGMGPVVCEFGTYEGKLFFKPNVRPVAPETLARIQQMLTPADEGNKPGDSSS